MIVMNVSTQPDSNLQIILTIFTGGNLYKIAMFLKTQQTCCQIICHNQIKLFIKFYYNYAGQMGVLNLAPGSAHAWPSAQPPIDTSGIVSAHMSEGGGGVSVFSSLIHSVAIVHEKKKH